MRRIHARLFFHIRRDPRKRTEKSFGAMPVNGPAHISVKEG